MVVAVLFGSFFLVFKFATEMRLAMHGCKLHCVDGAVLA